MRTVYFTHCWGVFEGGGVRGAAHAGAYAAARNAGIHFGRVAGTSAGSIVAALIAAGASPDYVSKQVRDTPFTTFIGPPNVRDSVFSPPSWWLRSLRAVSGGLPRAILNVACNAGLYSSKPIESWLEGVLKELLSERKPDVIRRPVEFRDLTIPLHVVASDLGSARPHVWSTEKTPNESVAFAVRCSASIPLFYQAVRYGQAVLVDGGLLSNLPAFVFSTLSEHEQSALARTLSFQLIGAPSKAPNPIASLPAFISRLADTAIGGGTAIQLALQPDVYSIHIDTGEVSSTDFEGMTPELALELHESGEKAVAKFLTRERALVRQKPSQHVQRGFDAKLLQLVQGLASCEKCVAIVTSSTYWINFVFPACLAAVRRGIRFVIYAQPSSDSKELAQRSLLRRLGAIIHEPEQLPFDGFIFDFSTESTAAVISAGRGRVGEEFGYTEEEISTYDGTYDKAVIDSLTKTLPNLPSSSFPSVGELPFTAVRPQQLFERLKRVPQYRNATFELTRVQITSSLEVLQRSIKEYKALQITTLIRDFRDRGLSLFHPQAVVFDDGSQSIVTPPILERLGDRLVLIEGNTRAFHCLREGVEEMTAVVVDGVDARLPADPFSISNARLTSRSVSLSDNLTNYDKRLFRKIEEAVHED